MALLDDGLEAVAKSLQEFGYPDSNVELIRDAYETWISGKEVKGDIVKMMAVGQFEEYPQIFGAPPSPAPETIGE